MKTPSQVTPHVPNSVLMQTLAPEGILRFAINLGNPLLASGPHTNPRGVSVDIAVEFSRNLNMPCELKAFQSAGKAVQAMIDGEVDLAFLAIDPARRTHLAFTKPYVALSARYLVRQSSSFMTRDQIDRKGVRIAVGKGSAYDLFLTRELKSANLIRTSTSAEVVDVFLAQNLEVAAGISQQLEADMARCPGLRLIEGDFMSI